MLAVGGTSAEYALTTAGTGDAEQVECVDLDRIGVLTGAAYFDFVKMDIEGVERELFAAWKEFPIWRASAPWRWNGTIRMTSAMRSWRGCAVRASPPNR